MIRAWRQLSLSPLWKPAGPYRAAGFPTQRAMANLKKDVNELVKAAGQQGWKVVETKRVWKLYDPSGEHLETVHKTPSAPATIRHAVARMRRYGFKWKGR